jgi:molybdopterin molybdotransferase
MSGQFRFVDRPSDVRMTGFSGRVTVSEAQAWVQQQSHVLPAEDVDLGHLIGRVLAKDVVSDVDVPGFARSMMDGFAVQAADTLGASPYNRLPLRMVGTSLPGGQALEVVSAGQAVKIMTGAAMPAGADAVLPVEQAECETAQVYVLAEVSPGKHVGRQGEDIARGTVVLRTGRKIRPQDVGVLSSIGIARASVVRPACVRIVVTGNELLPAGSQPSGNRIADANGPMLAALVRRDGGIPVNPGIVADDPEAILAAMRSDADVVLVSGGSSVGQEDHAPNLLARHGELAIHGVAMRPSSPAGMGIMANRLVFLLPGNPVSCLCAYDFFAGRAIRRLAGLPEGFPYVQARMPLRRKLVSVVGRVDYARVRIFDGQVEPIAISGASILSSTTRADGFVIIPEDSEGYPAGAEVIVWLY